MNVYDIADAARLVWSRSWRWLVWSPKRLGSVVVAVVVIVFGWTQITGAGPGMPSDADANAYTSDDLPSGWQDWQHVTADPESEADPVDPAPSTPTESESSPETHEDPDDDHAAHEPPSKKTKQKAMSAAEGFAKAYVRTKRSKKTWYKKVAPHAVKQLRKPLKTVNPKSIGIKRITGKAKIDSLGDMGGRIVVPTNAGKLVLGVTNTGSRWSVSKVIPPKSSTSPR